MRHLGAVSPSSLQPRSPSSNDLQVNLAPRLRRPSYAARDWASIPWGIAGSFAAIVACWPFLIPWSYLLLAAN